jgi:hypothetical protein
MKESEALKMEESESELLCTDPTAVKATLVHSMKTYKSRGTAPPILNLSTRRKPGQHQVPAALNPGWAPQPVWTLLLLFPRFDPQTVQPVPSRCFDRAIPAAVCLLFWSQYWAMHTVFRKLIYKRKESNHIRLPPIQGTLCSILLEIK